MKYRTKNSEILLEESFEAGLKHSLYSNFKRWADAFLELADNAVSNRIPGRQLLVEIGTSPKHLRIANKNGLGMNLEGLRTFLKWGIIKTRSSYDIGAYSQGGKAAMGYLGRSMSITVSPDKENRAYRISDDDLHNFDKLKSYRPLELSIGDTSGFVEVEVDQLKRNIKPEELDVLIAETYRPLIEHKDIKVIHNSKEIKPKPFPLDSEFSKQSFSFFVRHGNKNHWTVEGWVGRLTPRSGIKGGLLCYKLGRLICDKEFFEHPDANYKQTLNFLFGEVHLDHVPATTNKTDFDRDSDEWIEVQEEMFKILQPHVQDLLGREIREPSDEDKERVKKAKELFNEVLKLKNINLAGRSLEDLYAYGQKPSTPRDLPSQPKIKNERRNEPATPPPSDASGKRRRLKEFMDWELRPMDEAVRSVIEEDGGKKVLVINNLFPGYSAAKAHQLYFLETAAIQLAKPEQDEKITAEEYIERFDDLYAFICTHLDEAREKLEERRKYI